MDVGSEQFVENGRDALNRATGVLSGFLGALANFVIVLFVGLYGASEPGIHKRGFVQLFPIGCRLSGLGVALATPLTAVALVGTKRFYIEDTLGDHTAKAEKDQD